MKETSTISNEKDEGFTLINMDVSKQLIYLDASSNKCKGHLTGHGNVNILFGGIQINGGQVVNPMDNVKSGDSTSLYIPHVNITLGIEAFDAAYDEQFEISNIKKLLKDLVPKELQHMIDTMRLRKTTALLLVDSTIQFEREVPKLENTSFIEFSEDMPITVHMNGISEHFQNSSKIEDRAPVFLVGGDERSGKTVSSFYIMNRLLSLFDSVYYINLDPFKPLNQGFMGELSIHQFSQVYSHNPKLIKKMLLGQKRIRESFKSFLDIIVNFEETVFSDNSQCPIVIDTQALNLSGNIFGFHACIELFQPDFAFVLCMPNSDSEAHLESVIDNGIFYFPKNFISQLPTVKYPLILDYFDGVDPIKFSSQWDFHYSSLPWKSFYTQKQCYRYNIQSLTISNLPKNIQPSLLLHYLNGMVVGLGVGNPVDSLSLKYFSNSKVTYLSMGWIKCVSSDHIYIEHLPLCSTPNELIVHVPQIHQHLLNSDAKTYYSKINENAFLTSESCLVQDSLSYGSLLGA